MREVLGNDRKMREPNAIQPTAVPARHGPVDDEPQATPVQGAAQGEFRPGTGSPSPAHHP
jgi:hypothetical protein